MGIKFCLKVNIRTFSDDSDVETTRNTNYISSEDELWQESDEEFIDDHLDTASITTEPGIAEAIDNLQIRLDELFAKLIQNQVNIMEMLRDSW